MQTLQVLDIRDDDDFIIAVHDPNWHFGMGPRDSESDDLEHPFAIAGKLMDLREYIPECEMEEETAEFPIVFEAEIVPTNPCAKFLEEMETSCGHEGEIKEEHRLFYTIEGILSYGGAVPCTGDVLGASRQGVDPFEGLVEGEDYILYADGRAYFKDWDKAKAWAKAHLPNVAPAIGGMIGFTMDRPVNRMGTSGWDWVRPIVTGESSW